MDRREGRQTRMAASTEGLSYYYESILLLSFISEVKIIREFVREHSWAEKPTFIPQAVRGRSGRRHLILSPGLAYPRRWKSFTLLWHHRAADHSYESRHSLRSPARDRAPAADC